jgi:hypothetical protein
MYFYGPELGQIACELWLQASTFAFALLNMHFNDPELDQAAYKVLLLASTFAFALLKMYFYHPELGPVACEFSSELVIIGPIVSVHVMQ